MTAARTEAPCPRCRNPWFARPRSPALAEIVRRAGLPPAACDGCVDRAVLAAGVAALMAEDPAP